MLHSELGQTVRVNATPGEWGGRTAPEADGAITRGIDVPHKGANVKGDNRVIAAPMAVVRSRRFVPASIPSGVDQHLPCTIEALRKREEDPKCEECRSIDNRARDIR